MSETGLLWGVLLPFMVGDGADGLELDGALHFVHAELMAAFLSAVL